MTDFEQFLRELKRRRVYRVAFVYAAAAFVIWQAAEIAFPALGFPDWALTLVVVLTIVGLPVALVLGWAFDITPEGIRRTEPFDAALRRTRGVPRWLTRSEVVLGGVAVVLLLIWWPWRRPGPDPLAAFAELTFVDSVAVLPIENQTGDPTLDPLVALVTEEIVRQLKRVNRIKVSDLFSVRQLLGLELTHRQIADSLGIQKVVHGSIYEYAYRMGDRVSFSVTVGDVHAGTTLISDQFEADPTEEYEAAVELADAFVHRFLSDYPELNTVAAEAPSPEGPGYDAYLVGKTWLGRRTPNGLALAHASFEEALERDPDYAFAYSGLSHYYALADAYRYVTDAPGYRTAGLALAYANRAMELEPDLAEAYTSRILMARRSFAPMEAVAADCKRAIELEPSTADGLSWCAPLLSERGEVDQGFHTAEQAIAMDPQNAGRRVSITFIAMALGRYNRAAREARMAWQLEPELMLPRALEAWALLLAGDAEECATRELGPHEVIRATCLYEMGEVERASAIADSVAVACNRGTLDDDVYTEVIRAEDLAVYHAWKGDAAESLRWLRSAYDGSPSGIDSRIYASALFNRVREDVRFVREVESIRAGIWARVQEAGDIAYREYFGGMEGS